MPDNLPPERRAQLDRERSQNGSRATFYDTKSLTNDYIRLLPLEPTENIGTKWVSYFLNKKNFTCPEETPAYGTPSVIAKARRALERLGTDKSLAMAESLKKARKAKWLMKIISRKDAATAKWFESPYAIYKIIFEALEKDGREVYHPNRGRDVRITKEGSGMGTTYSAAVQDESQLAETREERDALRQKAREMDVGKLTAPNESGALEALKTLIPADLWDQIKGEVLGAAAAAADRPTTASRSTARAGDEDAPSRGTAREDDDAPRPAAKRAAPPADDDAPAPRRAAPAPVQDDDAPAPAPARRAAAPVVEDDDAPRPAAKKAAPPADDDEPPKPAAKKAAPVVPQDDDEAPRPAANGKRAVVVDDAPAPTPARTARPQVQDDD